MPKLISAREEVERLMNKTQESGFKCLCNDLNMQLTDIEENHDHDMGIVCCPVCCDCHWDRLLEDL